MLTVIAVPAFQDNYLWLLVPDDGRNCYAVDPGDAAAIEAALKTHDLVLAGILLTHHHWDHTGGVDDLLKQRSIPVYGPKSEQIPQVTNALSEGDSIELAEAARLSVIEVPGHTLDHIAYFDSASQSLFCGDALFAGGCGRMFEGNPRQMQASLEKLAGLPAETQVYCAHEYTAANLRFAQAVEPNNQTLSQRVKDVASLREDGKSTVPSLLSDEWATNPFLRCSQVEVQSAASNFAKQSLTSVDGVFAALRRWKDNF
ncbi:MAG: hydroxyacylglutathione hydrolase [Cellvibrionaceae bacterium]|nr:hydroxyacylglutathione hydrolase [Cellvibrionaceae bacterium]|tara:strand:+ start:30103 stop:30876 length:774 start_codon:yes stop_codon:yes gene_type:complete